MTKITGREDSLADMQPESYLDGQMKSMIRSIGKNWIKDGGNRRDYSP